ALTYAAPAPGGYRGSLRRSPPDQGPDTGLGWLPLAVGLSRAALGTGRNGAGLRAVGCQPPGAVPSMDAKQVWRAALGELQVSLSPANYETWLKDTALVSVDENHFRVAVPNGFAKDWLETRYRSLISQTLARVVGYSVNVEVEVRELPSETAGARADRADRGADQQAPRPAAAVVGVVDATGHVTPRITAASERVRLEPGRVGGPEGSSVSLNPRYTFRNFIVGSANRLAHAASLSVAERPGHAYNPLFLYGG